MPKTSVSDPAQPSEELDPITFSVILSRFQSIVEEMTRTFEATAWSSIIAFAHDFSCAVYDAVPRQISMGEALPMHTTSLDLVLAEIQRTFDGDVHEGDVFLCNSPYRGNTHVGDVVTAEPVFGEGRHLFWAVTKGHQLDIGAYIPSSVCPSARDVWQEGLQIPPVRIYHRGKPLHDVIDFYISNVRYMNSARGDLFSQIGSIGKGRTRLVELVEEYGADKVLRYIDAILDYADRRMAEGIRRIPDGEYTAEGWVDSDGATETNVPIKVKVTVADDQVYIDYTGSAAQSPRGLNATLATSQAAAAISFLTYVDPDVPHNQGCLRHIHAFAPEGSMCNARYPASTSCATMTPAELMADLVHKALAPAIPDRVSAGSARSGFQPTFSGIDERTGEPWSCMLFNGAGGGGASKGVDGWPIWLGPGAAGGCKNVQVEQIELLYPLCVLQLEIEPESMGLGQWLGGPGVRFACRPTHGAIDVVTFGDGQLNPPHGVLGGTMGFGGGQYAENGDSGKRRYASVTAHCRIGMGEAWISVSGGGGGYGNPIDREAGRVRSDVRDELITQQTAAALFGVVLSDHWNPEIDEPATVAVRAELTKLKRPLIDPTVPAGSTWLQESMREGDEYLLNPEGC